jgi:hypothetical protein
MTDIIDKIIPPTDGPSLQQRLKDIQERASESDSFKCEHKSNTDQRCNSIPDYIVYNPWKEEMSLKCGSHRFMTDIIIRWFNRIHRVWEHI